MGNAKVGIFEKIPRFWMWVLFTILVTVVTFTTVFQPVWSNIIFNVVMPICVLIFLKPVFFERMKLTTLITLRLIVPFLLIFAIYHPDVSVTLKDWFAKAALVLLAVNIMEATLTDLLRYKKYFNFVSGLALVAAIFAFWMTTGWHDGYIWNVNANNELGNPENAAWFTGFYTANVTAPTRVLSMLATISWCIAYTIWNWIFVSNEFSDSIAYLHFGILGAPLIGMIVCLVGWLQPGIWLLYRANSLTFGGGVVQIVWKPYWEKKLQSEKASKFINWTKKTGPQAFFMVLNILLCLFPIACAIASFVLKQWAIY